MSRSQREEIAREEKGVEKTPKGGSSPMVGDKEDGMRLEAKLSGLEKAPYVGAPPGVGGKNEDFGRSGVDEKKGGEMAEDFIDGEERTEDKTADPGGAEKAVVQGDSWMGDSKLSERVKHTLFTNLVQELSLREVGFALHQCFMECCKPMSTAKLPKKLPVDSGDLACAVQGDPSLETWCSLVTLALQHLGGLSEAKLADFRCEAAEKESIRVQLERFDVWDEKFDVVGFEKLFQTKTIDYSGDEVRTAQYLNWKAVENSLPEGVGNLKLTDFCTLGTKGYIERFEDYLVPEEVRVRLKPPRVMVEEGQWDDLARGLIQRNICTVIPLEETYHVNNEPLLNGLFAVGKNEFVGQLETQRLIMNLTPVNHLCRELSGDISTLPTLANFGLMTLGEGEVLLTSSEDVRCFFFLFETPKTWHRYMAFNRELSPDLVPEVYRGKTCYLASRVLPMGFANSVSIAQHVHRNVVRWSCMDTDPPIGGEGEIRKDRSFPSSPSKFRVYLDNFDQLEVVNVKLANEIQGKPSEQVLALRERYSMMNLPRHPRKAVVRELRAEVQGALVLGDKGIAMPKPQKLLQYMRLTMELLVRGECKLRELQVVCGGPGDWFISRDLGDHCYVP